MICRNGRGVIEDYGPSRARLVGGGGAALGQVVTLMKSPWSRPAPHKRMLKVNDRPRCGKILPRLREPCFRREGHRDNCRPMASVLADTERRRVTK